VLANLSGGRIFSGQFEGFFEGGFGLGQFAALQLHPAQRVEIVGVVRRGLDGAAGKDERFVELEAVLGQKRRETVAHVRLVRTRCERLPEELFGLPQLALLAAHGRQVHIDLGFDSGRRAFEDGTQHLLRFGEFPAHGIEDSEVEASADIVGINLQRLTILPLGFIEPPLLAQKFSEIVVGGGRARVNLKGLPIHFLGLGELASQTEHSPQAVEGDGVVRLDFEGFSVERFGLVELEAAFPQKCRQIDVRAVVARPECEGFAESGLGVSDPVQLKIDVAQDYAGSRVGGLQFDGFECGWQSGIGSGFGSVLTSWGIIGTLIGVGCFFLKMYFLIFSVVWIRWTFPRTQFYGLLNLSWKILIPISLFTLLLTSVLLKLPRLF